MSREADYHETIWDAIEGALSICDPEDVTPVDTFSLIRTAGAHGMSKPHGLLVKATNGKTYRITAEEVV